MVKLEAKSIEGNVIELNDKAPNYKSAYIGSTIFGLGWAMTGACQVPCTRWSERNDRVPHLHHMGILGFWLTRRCGQNCLTEMMKAAVIEGALLGSLLPCPFDSIIRRRPSRYSRNRTRCWPR